MDLGLKSRQDKWFISDRLTGLGLAELEVGAAEALFLLDAAVFGDVDACDLVGLGVGWFLSLFQQHA